MSLIKNNVIKLSFTDTKTFLSWDFNKLKDDKRDTTKLENSILKSGWNFPVIIWKNFVIDGTGRKQAVENLIKKGHTIEKIPYVEIHAENLKEAKAKALEVSSQFGRITRDSFKDYVEGLDLDFDTFEISGIKEDIFNEVEDTDLDFEQQIEIVITCKDLAEQEEMFMKLKAEGYNARILNL